MSKFIRANAALGGRLNDYEGKPVALRLLSTTPVMVGTTEFGKQPALRARVIDIESAEDKGVFLVFWDGVKRTLIDNVESGYEYTIGVPTKEPHPTNEGHDLWTLADAAVTDDQIEAALA